MKMFAFVAKTTEKSLGVILSNEFWDFPESVQGALYVPLSAIVKQTETDLPDVEIQLKGELITRRATPTILHIKPDSSFLVRAGLIA